MLDHYFKWTIISLLISCIITCISCGSDSTTGPDNGDTGLENMISGQILRNNGSPDKGISVIVSSSDTSFTITSDNDGYFTFFASEATLPISLVPTPAIQQNKYVPESITLTDSSKNNIVFIGVAAEANGPQIAGMVTDKNGISIDTIINISTSNKTMAVDTENNGIFYSIIPESDSITVMPKSDDRFTYEPDSYTFDSLHKGENVSCIFNAIPSTELYSIYCTIDNIPIEEYGSVIVRFNEESQWIKSNSFEFNHILPGEYTLEIRFGQYEMESMTVTISDSDVYLTNIMFTYRGATEYSVTGRVVTDNGDNIENVDILYYLFKGYQYIPDITTTETSNTGEYEFTCKSGINGDAVYHIIPHYEGYTFEPDTLSVTIPFKINTENGGLITIPDIIAIKYTVYQPNSFFPIAESNKWTFAVTDEQDNEYDLEMAIDGAETAGGFAYSRFTTSGPGGMTLLRIDGEDVHAWNGDEDIVMLRFGVVPGTEWASGTDSAGYKRTGVFLGLEEETVPAGTFTDCLRYESRLNYGETTYEAHEMWFAEDIGLVRQVRTLVNYGKEIERTEMELVVYNGQ